MIEFTSHFAMNTMKAVINSRRIDALAIHCLRDMPPLKCHSLSRATPGAGPVISPNTHFSGDERMPRVARRPRLSPGFHLEEIKVRIPLGTTTPVVELSGRAITGNPRVDAISRVTVATTALTAAGQRFIEEMEAQFAEPPAPAARPKTDA
jgi:hypothetical protein